jgi:bacteriophage N4 adsorption protein B
MISDSISVLVIIMWGLLIFSTLCTFISGLDDVFFDIYYWIYFFWRSRYIRKKKLLTYETLAKKEQKYIAVMVACWHEAGVIEEMLRYNVNMIDYQHYDIFVGVYPNDEKTVASVQSVADLFPNVHCIVGEKLGPTNKASNLNSIYAAVCEYEKKMNRCYDIFVIHDSEDIIHPYSFMLFNYLTPKNDMIQIPILPLDISLRYFTHWTYNAEFCELHTKDLIVREQIHGFVPSAGVGTAFSRRAIEVLKEVRGNVPFSTYSLTEDYSTALELKLHKLREIFVLQYIHRSYWRKKWFFFGPLLPYRQRECIATRALFPMTYYAAVRQKTRWILGIAFQEWIHTGWKGNFATMYTLFHDRKSLFTHLVNGLFLIQIPFWTVYLYLTTNVPDYTSLQDLFDANPWVWSLIAVSSLFMVNRFIQRAIAVFRTYGFFPALLSAPLILYANIINLHALLRAYYLFIFSPQSKASSVKWDKTDHTFPKHDVLTLQKMKLGDLLIEKNILSKNELIDALSEQAKTGEQLGAVLVRLGYVSQAVLNTVLASQHHMMIIKKSDLIVLPYDSLKKISRFNYDRLIKNRCYPMHIEDDRVLMAIEDSYNEDKLLVFLSWIKPYKGQFAMLDKS